MADWLEGIKRQDFGTNGGSWTRQPAIIVLHSTETGDGGWPGYDSGNSAPHFTIDPRTGEVRQHISMAHAARALRNPSGGVETNRGGAIQIEIIGTCDPERDGDAGWTFLPDWSNWGSLGNLVSRIGAECNIPLQSSVTFRAFPGSYGENASQRLSGSAWNSYKGVLGHQHVPENDHGDPGDINIDEILSGDDDMPLSDDDLDKIALRVWGYKNTAATNKDAYAFQFDVANQVIKTDGTIEAPDRVATPENPTWALSTMIHNMGEWILTCRDYTQADGPIQSKLDALQADVDAIQAALEGGGTVIPDPCAEGRTMDATWRVLVILALLAATVGILLATR